MFVDFRLPSFLTFSRRFFRVVVFPAVFPAVLLSCGVLSASVGAISGPRVFSAASSLTAHDVYVSAGNAGFSLPCRSGRLCARRLGDGDTVYYGYDAKAGGLRGEPTRTVLADSLGAVLASQDNVYDRSGELTSRTVRYADGTGYRRDYVYDGERRLVSATDTATGGRSVWRYAYDGNGNRVWAAAGPSSSYDGLDRLSGAVYGPRGGLAADAGHASCGYDDRGRTLRCDSSAGRFSYAYRPSGLLGSVSSGGSALRYYYGGDTLLDATDGRGGVSHYLSFDGVSGRALTGASASARYYYADYAGTPVSTLDASGGVAARFAYAPYGALEGESASDGGLSLRTNPIGFQGRYRLPTGDSVYARRFYDGAGRFTTRDGQATPNAYRAYDDDPVGHGDDGGNAAFSLLERIVPTLGADRTEDAFDESAGQAPAESTFEPGIAGLNDDETAGDQKDPLEEFSLGRQGQGQRKENRRFLDALKTNSPISVRSFFNNMIFPVGASYLQGHITAEAQQPLSSGLFLPPFSRQTRVLGGKCLLGAGIAGAMPGVLDVILGAQLGKSPGVEDYTPQEEALFRGLMVAPAIISLVSPFVGAMVRSAILIGFGAHKKDTSMIVDGGINAAMASLGFAGGRRAGAANAHQAQPLQAPQAQPVQAQPVQAQAPQAQPVQALQAAPRGAPRGIEMMLAG